MKYCNIFLIMVLLCYYKRKVVLLLKEILKRIIVLVLVTLLLLTPSITVLAATQSVLVYENPSIGWKYFEYQPTSLIIQPDTSDILRDVSSSAWYIQAGKHLWFHTKFDFASTYQFRVLETQPTSRVVTDITGFTDGCGVGLTIPESGYYLLEITPKTSLGAFINSYIVQIE